MQIVIDIPKEFEEEFNRDKFEDSLSRVASDIESFGFQLAGRYEQETIRMLREAIKSSTPLPKHHGRLIDADEAIKNLKSLGNRDYRREKGTIQDAEKMLSSDKYTPTIIEGSDSK